MPAPKNQFKQALLQHQPQFGIWVAMANPVAAELCAGAGYEWVLIDGEHGPNDIPSIHAQLQAVAAQAAHPVVRLPVGEPWLIKQALDIGAQSLLIPMIETAEQAEQVVKAAKYPPQGIRGVGAGLGRATNYSRVDNYLTTANDEICMILQIESRKGIANLDAISTLDGVDAVFLGPADLGADMGYLGQSGVAEVEDAVVAAIKRIRELGKPAGVMTYDRAFAARCHEAGANLVSFVSDVQLLTEAASRELANFKSGTKTTPGSSRY